MYLDVEIKKLKAFLRQNFEFQSQSNFVRHCTRGGKGVVRDA